MIEEKKHSVFTRNGDNLKMELDIDLIEALTGFDKTVTHLNGSTIPVSGGKTSPIKVT